MKTFEFGRRADGNQTAEIGLGADAAEIVALAEGRRPRPVQKSQQDTELAAGRRKTVEPGEIVPAARTQHRIRGAAEDTTIKEPSRNGIHQGVRAQVYRYKTQWAPQVASL